jgi:hypothetical protein
MGRGGEHRGIVEQRESGGESAVGPRGRHRGDQKMSKRNWIGCEK